MQKIDDRSYEKIYEIKGCAVLLVFQAAAMGNGGEVFVLNMKEPVKIVHLAEELIKLNGLKPYDDIEIVFTGLRPGEKLFEEIKNIPRYSLLI